MIWQLGQADQSHSEFMPMESLDFCRNPELLASANFDPKSHRFTYAISANGREPAPRLPAGLTSRRGVPWYGTPLCTTLTLSWDEKAAGDRTLEIHTAAFRRENGLGRKRDFEENDLRVNLPGHALAYLQMKNTQWNANTDEGKGKADLAWRVPLRVKPGLNTLTLEMRNPWNGASVYFDYLALVKSAATPTLQPAMEMETRKLISMYLPDERVSLSVKCYNLKPSTAYGLKYQVIDFYHQVQEEKTLEFKTDGDGYGAFDLNPAVTRFGYFKINADLIESNGKKVELAGQPYLYRATFVRGVKDPELDQEVPDSHFGIHTSLEGYNGPMDTATAEKYADLSRLMGAKLMRINAFLWMNIEPAKGSYNWQDWDRMVAVFRAHKLVILGCLLGTPTWARLHPTESYTNNGFFEEPMLEPWLRFVTTIVARYKDKIGWWEIWNEPFSRPTYFWSAYGTEYGTLVKNSYDPIKKIMPTSTVVLGMTHVTPNGTKFQQETLAACGRERFDVFNDHYLDLNACVRWKSFREENQYPQPLWDTENNAETPAGIIKIAARNLAYGVDKTFFFTLNYDQWTDTYDDHVVVNPFCATFRTASDQLEHAHYLGALNTGEGTETYCFKQGNETVVIAWSNDENQKTSISTGVKSVKIYDAMDNPLAVPTENGLLNLTLTPEPVIIRGLGLNEIMAYTAFQIDPIETVITCGSTQKFQVNICNTETTRQAYKIAFKLPVGWKMAVKTTTFTLAPQEKKTLAATLTVPATAGHQKYLITGVLETSGDQQTATKSFPLSIITTEQPIGVNLMQNGGFEEVQANGLPVSWSYFTWDGKSTATLGLNKDAAHSGHWGMRFSSPAKSDKAILHFTPSKMISVLPGEKYLFGLWCKGDRDGLIASTHIRQYDPAGKYISTDPLAFTFNPERVWTRPYGVYTVPPGIARLEIALVYWQTKGIIDCDEVSLVQIKKVPAPDKLKFRMECVKADRPPNMDGTLAGFEKARPIRLDQKTQTRRAGGAANDDAPYDWAGPADLSADFYALWDKDYLYLTVKVTDNVFAPYHVGDGSGDTYMGDSLQVALDPSNDAKNMFQDYVEMIVSRAKNGGNRIYQWNYLPNPLLYPDLRSGLVDRAKIKTTPLPPGGVLYQAAIPWACLGYPELKPGKAMGFSLLINDNDGQGRRGWLQWSSGIGQEKSPQRYGTMVLTETP